MTTATTWQRDRTNPDRPYGITQSVPPNASTLAVSLSDTKAWLNIADADTSHDAKITSLIRAATAFFESMTQYQCLTATFVLSLDGFPNDDLSNNAILLPRWPVETVTSVRYVDTDGDTQTISSANYNVSRAYNVSRISPNLDYVWPATKQQDDVVAVIFTAGNGAATDDVPDLVQTGIKMLVAHMFENPEPVNIGNITTELPLGLMSIVQDYRLRVR